MNPANSSICRHQARTGGCPPPVAFGLLPGEPVRAVNRGATSCRHGPGHSKPIEDNRGSAADGPVVTTVLTVRFIVLAAHRIHWPTVAGLHAGPVQAVIGALGIPRDRPAGSGRQRPVPPRPVRQRARHADPGRNPAVGSAQST